MFRSARFRMQSLSPCANERMRAGSQIAPLTAKCAQFLFVLLFLSSILLNSSAFPQQAAAPSKGAVPQNSAGDPKRAGTAATSADPGSRISFEELIKKSGIRFQLKNSISPQRYSIETMLGGVAVFDYNNEIGRAHV